jgi:hypothetical protein
MNQMTTLAAKHKAKRNGKPVQLLFIALTIACTTLGPMILDCFKLTINPLDVIGKVTYITICDPE